MKDVEEVWNIIETYKAKRKTQTEKEQKNIANENTKNEISTNKRKNDESIQNGSTEEPEIKKKKNKKTETTKETDTVPVQDSATSEDFNFQTKIISVLESKTTISLKKLQKKVIKAYLKHTGATEVTPKIEKKFSKKLKKIPNVEIADDVVSLK